MQKRFSMKMLLALILTLVLTFGEFAAVILAGSDSPFAVQAETQLIAKSKKKKNTPTPKPTKAPRPTKTPAPTENQTTPVPDGPIIDPQGIADYLYTYGHLPDNFITKQEAQALGWDRNYLSDVAPGKSLGGSHYGNYEGILPSAKGRKFYECDCWYKKGKRNAYRLVFSNDGHVWYTDDHYETFTELEPTVPAERKYWTFTVH